PQQARLHNTHVWCAGKANADQHLEIDLGLVTMIKSIAIQGNPNDDEFVKTFSLSYAVLEGRWLTYLENGVKRIVSRTFDYLSDFPGNFKSGEVTIQTLQTITAARYVRINPETWFSHVCIRTELYGCEAKPTLPLGMMSGEIPDSLVTASTSWTGLPGSYGRLHWTKYGSNQVWSAGTLDTNQWLQIDLSRMEFVTAIATQGRHAHNQRVTSYYLSYGNDTVLWTEYLEGGVRKVFTGNSDGETVVRHVLPTVMYVRFVRFNPVTWNEHIAMRVEVYTYGRASPADLGIEDKEIPNNQITASSFYGSGFEPYKGRLNLGANSWCPKTKSGNHWLMFDFGHVMLVTSIVTQGRGNDVPFWVTGYQVSYSLDNINFIFYKDNAASQVKTFQGNTNDVGYVTRTLDRDIEARWIRIYPKTWIPSDNFVYSSEVCTNHRYLDDDSRLSTKLTLNLIQDDTNLTENDWYVFRGTRGYYRIPNKCLPQNRCGATATGYVEGNFPTLADVRTFMCATVTPSMSTTLRNSPCPGQRDIASNTIATRTPAGCFKKTHSHSFSVTTSSNASTKCQIV
ncbi:lactadherin-like, partial [Actinia tenebrosa]|uniref:Lactadherin-like n=1 Tax=Actinia tenebrosa TaxID=6105 RepID=A0A6P8J1S1_ACTTE